MVPPVRIRVSPLLFCSNLQVKHREEVKPRLWIGPTPLAYEHDLRLKECPRLLPRTLEGEVISHVSCRLLRPRGPLDFLGRELESILPGRAVIRLGVGREPG